MRRNHALVKEATVAIGVVLCNEGAPADDDRLREKRDQIWRAHAHASIVAYCWAVDLQEDAHAYQAEVVQWHRQQLLEAGMDEREASKALSDVQARRRERFTIDATISPCDDTDENGVKDWVERELFQLDAIASIVKAF
jgi:hypothetical protein